MMRIIGLTVRLGTHTVIDDLHAELNAPVCGLIGPNGAGKTTLINVLSGFVQASQGEIWVEGLNLLTLPPTSRVRWGLRRSFQTEQVVEDMTVWDNVQAVLDHVPHRKADEQIARALEATHLAAMAGHWGRDLNLFQRRMLEMAKTMVGSPRLVLLDEPGAGLDERESALLQQVIVTLPAHCGAQVLLIDHDVALIAATCGQTLVLDFGKRLALGDTREVLNESAVRRAYLGT